MDSFQQLSEQFYKRLEVPRGLIFSIFECLFAKAKKWYKKWQPVMKYKTSKGALALGPELAPEQEEEHPPKSKSTGKGKKKKRNNTESDHSAGPRGAQRKNL